MWVRKYCVSIIAYGDVTKLKTHVQIEMFCPIILHMGNQMQIKKKREWKNTQELNGKWVAEWINKLEWEWGKGDPIGS